MVRPDCFLFDFGNVIGFFDHGHACKALAALSEADLTPEEVRQLVFGGDLELRYDRGEISTEAFLEELRRRLRLAAPRQAIVRAWGDIFLRNERVCRLLPRLKNAGARLVLASNTNEIHFQYLKDEYADVLRHFARLVLSFQVGAVKPEPRFFQAVLEAAAVPPQRCFYLDDRPDLIQAARGLGIPGRVYSPALDLPTLLWEFGYRLEPVADGTG
jgi:putative hydrolase of the HAD superfamily